MTRKELQRKLGLKDEKYFREFYQQAGVAAGLIEMTTPANLKAVCRNTGLLTEVGGYRQGRGEIKQIVRMNKISYPRDS